MSHNTFLIFQKINLCFTANKPGVMVLDYLLYYGIYISVKGHAHWVSVYFIPKQDIILIFRGILLLYHDAQSSKMSLTTPKRIN